MNIPGTKFAFICRSIGLLSPKIIDAIRVQFFQRFWSRLNSISLSFFREYVAWTQKMAALISCASKQIQIMNKLLQTEEKKIREKDKKE